MTVQELMDQVDRLHPNQFITSDKVSWLNRVEQTIWREIIMTHEPEGESIYPEMPVYTTADVSPSQGQTSPTLLAEDPYSKLYPAWMDAQIAYHNRESLKYSDAMTVFNMAMSDYSRWYNRTHMPTGAVNHLHIIDRMWGVT